MKQTGLCQTKEKVAFYLRYCSLSADGKLYAARSNRSVKKKHMLDIGKSTTLELARNADLIIKDHKIKEFVNEFSRYNNIILHFAWVFLAHFIL